MLRTLPVLVYYVTGSDSPCPWDINNIPEGLSQWRDDGGMEVTAVKGLILSRQSDLKNFRPFFFKNEDFKIIGNIF